MNHREILEQNPDSRLFLLGATEQVVLIVKKQGQCQICWQDPALRVHTAGVELSSPELLLGLVELTLVPGALWLEFQAAKEGR